ncbi:hypothetical protein VXQ16_19525, partial [Acinetobacter baumannii]
SKIGFGDLILLLRYFFKLKVSTHPISIFYFLLKKTKKYRSNNIIDELNFFRKLLLTIKIFRS